MKTWLPFSRKRHDRSGCAPRPRLIAHQANHLRIGSNKSYVTGFADFRKIGGFGQKSVPGVNGFRTAELPQIPGNVLAGNWREVIYVDDKASPQQRQAILDAWTGKLGGPLADLASHP